MNFVNESSVDLNFRRKYTSFFKALERGILSRSEACISASNPQGICIVYGGILEFTSDAVGGNAEMCNKQQVWLKHS